MSSSAPASAPSSSNSSTCAPSAVSSAPKPPRVVIVPGNGCRKIERANWYCNVGKQLTALGCDVRVQTMPDPDEAKESIWIPFIKDTLGADENTILIGHSSGAEAGMRFAERYPLRGLILVSACHTDLGCASETISGYYPDPQGNHPWLWDAIRANVGWIVQYHSTDDPFIPPAEARHVAQNLQTEYVEFTNRDHFMARDMKEVGHGREEMWTHAGKLTLKRPRFCAQLPSPLRQTLISTARVDIAASQAAQAQAVGRLSIHHRKTSGSSTTTALQRAWSGIRVGLCHSSTPEKRKQKDF